MFSFSTKQYHVSREANLESFVAARVTSLKPRILWVLQTLVSYVIWPLVAGTAPTASSLDAVILLDLWVCAGMCCWDLWLLPWSWPARLQTLPSCGPHCVSLLLVASQHICIHHWDKPKLLSLVHAMLLPQGWNLAYYLRLTLCLSISCCHFLGVLQSSKGSLPLNSGISLSCAHLHSVTQA